jgi:glycosyltransferase involved in cell wall biosynthesis
VSDGRPRITLLADRPGWAFDFVARSIAARLADRYAFRIRYVRRRPRLDPRRTDLLYVFFWGETWHQRFGFPPHRVIKEVASWRWAHDARFGPLTAQELVDRHLAECGIVTTPSRRLHEALSPLRDRVVHCPNGVETGIFRPAGRRRGPLRIGWVGNPDDDCKGLRDLLIPACAGRFALETTDGRRTRREVARLYRRVDVIAVASTAESQPLPLLEGMASGLFPVATDVGIVPELVRSGVNGLVVERSVEAFREAFGWCAEHLRAVRRAGAFNAELVTAERSWDRLAARFAEVFDAALERGPAPAPTPPRPARRAAAGPAPARSRPRRALARGRIPLRIAFVTPEFASEYATGGGLGGYLHRMTRALCALGHEPEVFALSPAASGPIDFDGVRVHRVRRSDAGRAARAWLGLAWRLGLHALQPPVFVLADARRLARALARREAERPFDLVQSADYGASGYFIASRPGRPHLVRCSADGLLWAGANRDAPPRRRGAARLERACVRRADLAYAPSRFVASGLGHRYGLDVRVLRPPAALEAKPRPEAAAGLPERYLVHFGQLSAAKGTAVLARALPAVWEAAPDFAMVWAGTDRSGHLEAWRAAWGERSAQVHWLGALARPDLYGVVQAAEAAVLPSIVDNLPNTAIESLLLGVPVIGSAGASLDELVEPERTGALVPIGDADALARAMLGVWRGESPVRRGFRWDGPRAREMHPETAARNLLLLAGLDEEA